MNRRGLCRPSLKITRSGNHSATDRFRVEVWNPFVHEYQPVDTVETAGPRWAEFRINATTFRSYDTRSDDRPAWAKATDMKQAAATVCLKVGYMLESAAAP